MLINGETGYSPYCHLNLIAEILQQVMSIYLLNSDITYIARVTPGIIYQESGRAMIQMIIIKNLSI